MAEHLGSHADIMGFERRCPARPPVWFDAGMRAIGRFVDGFDGNAAVYARHLGTGREMIVGEVDRPFPTGSAAKVLVLLAFAERVAAGDIDPTARVGMTASYRDARPGSGVLRHLAPGLEPTLHDLATLMMIVSDNVATDLLLDALGGPAPVNAAVQRLGGGDARVTAPTVWSLPPAQFGMASPRGLASAWEVLDRPGPIADLCKTITWRHQHREGFARLVPFSPDLPDFGLPSPLKLWSKAGSYPSVSCEGGLFESDHARWVLVVMADGVKDWGNGAAAAGPTLRARVSKAVFDAWNGSEG